MEVSFFIDYDLINVVDADYRNNIIEKGHFQIFINKHIDFNQFKNKFESYINNIWFDLNANIILDEIEFFDYLDIYPHDMNNNPLAFNQISSIIHVTVDDPVYYKLSEKTPFFNLYMEEIGRAHV